MGCKVQMCRVISSLAIKLIEIVGKKKKVLKFLKTFARSRHLLVVFGGLQGLEASVDTDQNLDVTDPSVLFDFYLNTCPCQGSRTIRTEVSAL